MVTDARRQALPVRLRAVPSPMSALGFLRGAPRLAPLITAIGMSFILQNVGLAWKGSDYVPVPDILPHSDVFHFGSVDYQWNKLIVLIVTVPVLLLLMWLVQQ